MSNVTQVMKMRRSSQHSVSCFWRMSTTPLRLRRNRFMHTMHPVELYNRISTCIGIKRIRYWKCSRDFWQHTISLYPSEHSVGLSVASYYQMRRNASQNCQGFSGSWGWHSLHLNFEFQPAVEMTYNPFAHDFSQVAAINYIQLGGGRRLRCQRVIQ